MTTPTTVKTSATCAEEANTNSKELEQTPAAFNGTEFSAVCPVCGDKNASPGGSMSFLNSSFKMDFIKAVVEYVIFECKVTFNQLLSNRITCGTNKNNLPYFLSQNPRGFYCFRGSDGRVLLVGGGVYFFGIVLVVPCRQKMVEKREKVPDLLFLWCFHAYCATFQLYIIHVKRLS